MRVSRGLCGSGLHRGNLSNSIADRGDGTDIGFTAAFLASEEARFITGINIFVDGGVSCGEDTGQTRMNILPVTAGALLLSESR